ncbi:MAG: CatA-like O-acetyltransferase [Acidobacteriota bacterium]
MSDTYRVVESYHRQPVFDFFAQYRNPFYATTFELDLTHLKAFIDEHGYLLYLNLCYYVTRAMSEIEDFRYRLLDGQLVLYDEIHPGLTEPAPGGLFTFAYYRYHPDVVTFNQRARQISQAAREGVELSDPEHRNGVWFTSLPKVPFTSFTHAYNASTDTEPQVAFGRYSEREGRLWVPLGIQVNHMLIDGNALGELVERTQKWFDAPA